MKLWVVSDLHLDHAEPPPWRECPEADVCVVAGDVCEGGPIQSLRWLARNVAPRMPVVFVAGNHEFYRSSIVEGLQEARIEAEQHANIHFLENSSVEIGGVSFVGATLWTDFALMGHRDLAMRIAGVEMRDYKRIKYAKQPFAKLHPVHTTRLHHASVEYIQRAAAACPDRTMVVTHHAPSIRSVAPGHGLIASAFASDLEGLISSVRPALWVHGHVHGFLDYRVEDTRIICNSLGYIDEPTYTDFRADFTVEVAA